MFEKFRIKEHMEVVDCQGRHVGTVDDIQDGNIKLTRADSADDIHHFLSIDDVDEIKDDRVCLKEGARIPKGLETSAIA